MSVQEMVYQGERDPCGVRGGTLVVLFRYIVVFVQVYYYYSLVKVYYNPAQVYRLKSCSSILLYYYKDLFTHKDINTYINGVV